MHPLKKDMFEEKTSVKAHTNMSPMISGFTAQLAVSLILNISVLLAPGCLDNFSDFPVSVHYNSSSVHTSNQIMYNNNCQGL